MTEKATETDQRLWEEFPPKMNLVDPLLANLGRRFTTGVESEAEYS